MKLKTYVNIFWLWAAALFIGACSSAKMGSTKDNSENVPAAKTVVIDDVRKRQAEEKLIEAKRWISWVIHPLPESL